MNTFTNFLLASVIISLVSFTFSNPTLAIEILQNYASAVYYTFSNRQWMILLSFFAYFKFLILFFYKVQRTRRYLYNGRDYVAQSLGTTGEQGRTGFTTDETNQSANSGSSLERALTLQTQVSPGLSEDILLPNARKEMPYSIPMYLGQYAFGTSATPGTVIFSILSNAITTSRNYQRLFIDRRFAKYDIRFTVNVTGNRSATGLLAIANLPHAPSIPNSVIDQDPAQDTTWTNYFDRVLSSNHAIIDVSRDGVYYIDMPFSTYYSYISTFNYGAVKPYAELTCICVSPYLPAAGQTTTINLEVYATLINIEHVETAPYVAQSLISFGGTETTNVVNTIENMKDSVLPVNVSGDTISASVPMPVGLDAPPDTRNAETSVFRMAYQKLMAWRNVFDVYKASPTPEIVETFTKDLADDLRVGTDEMSMDFFRGRWFSPTSTFTNYSVTTSTATGTRLFVFPIAPTTLSGTFTGTSTTTNCDFSQWFSGMFRYWNGSMKYRMLIASNMFKQGKILLCVNYGAPVSSAPATITTGQFDPRSVHHLIIDLANQDRVIDVDVPYKAIYEKLRTPAATQYGNDPTVGGLLEEEVSMGFIAAYVISPLQVSNNTATTINIAMLQSWGPDFNFYTPMQRPEIGYCSQASLPITGDTTKHHMSHMLEPFSSIKQLLTSSPSMIGSYTLPQVTNSTLPVSPIILPVHPVFQRGDPLWSMVSQAYAGIKGGYRLLLRFTGVNLGTSFRVQYYDSLRLAGASGGNLQPIAVGDEQVDAGTITGLWNSVITGNPSTGGGEYGYTSLPMLSWMPQMQAPSRINAVGSGTVEYEAKTGIPPIADVIVDPYSQPEVIIEIPDPSPIYRTQQVRGFSAAGVGAGYPFGDSGKYNPFNDRNVGWLVISPMDSRSPFSDAITITNGSVNVSLLAGDDFRAFWYNGGPTQMIQQFDSYYPVGGTAAINYNFGAK